MQIGDVALALSLSTNYRRLFTSARWDRVPRKDKMIEQSLPWTATPPKSCCSEQNLFKCMPIALGSRFSRVTMRRWWVRKKPHRRTEPKR